MFNNLRKKHPSFTYESYAWNIAGNKFTLEFVFKIGDLVFSPKIVFENFSRHKIASLNREIVDNLVFNVGMAEIPSYWKLACPQKIVIKAGYLNNEQIKWWKKLLIYGMGQFYFENKIDYRSKDFLQLVVQSSALKYPKAQVKSERPLVPVGGGKDSAVTLKILKDHFKVGAFVLNQTNAQKEVIAKSGIKATVNAVRRIDPKLLELNRKGYLNGHTPFSAVIAFLGVLSGYLFDYKYIVLSNEASSDEGNVSYLGKVVNHQYSKSYEFEQDFQNYNERFLSNTKYFSLLRPLQDIKIAHLFSAFEEYYSVFRSCNVGQKTNSWCGNCSKCLSTYILLTPFISQEKLDVIFAKNLLTRRALLSIFKDLVLNERVKPFECVGTREEIRASLNWLSEHSKGKMPLLNWYKKKVWKVPTKDETLSQILTNTYKDDLIPEDCLQVLKKFLDLPLPILKLKDKKVAILGFGIEGRDSYKFIRHYLPDKQLVIADRTPKEELLNSNKDLVGGDEKLDFMCGENYLTVLNTSDLVIKSQGVKESISEIARARQLKTIKIMSNTQMFFDHCKGKVIGITGSAGKTTTTSLIYHILQSTGKSPILVGNIGTAPLEQLTKSNNSNNLYVFELSSGQLSYLQSSPHIAVFLNIYREHLDFHLSYLDYFFAKANITKYQSVKDYFVYNQDFSKISNLQKITCASPVSFSIKNKNTQGYVSGQDILANFANKNWLFAKSNLPLLGNHNQLNVIAALLVAQITGVKKEDAFLAIKSFVPVEHRLEKVATVHEVLFVNDSICTIPESSLYAIDSFSQEAGIILLAGGFDRGLGYKNYAKELVKRKNLKAVILTGQTADEMNMYLKKFNYKGQIRLMKNTSMVERVKQAFRLSVAGNVVLLSSAAASYDMYKNFQDRGNQFKDAVKGLR